MDKFLQRKNEVLSKKDKSSKQSWDEKIAGLCDKINESDDCYTTSSCAGRIVIMRDEDKKAPDLFLKVWHDLIGFNELKKELGKIKNKDVKFKQEPVILHIACRDLSSARELYDKAKLVGFKRSGLVSFTEKRIILELNSTEKIEFPIKLKDKELVNEEFLQSIVKYANNNLKLGWGKINRLRKEIEKFK